MPQEKDRKTVLFVNPFTQAISGADESLIILINNLDKDKFKAVVALPGKSPYAPKFEEAGAKVITLRFSRIKRSVNPFYLIHYFISLFFEVGRFKRVIKKHKVDLVYANMEVVLSAGLAAKKLGVKCIYHYRHNASDEPKFIYDRLIRMIEGVADRICVISKAAGETFYKRGVKDKVTVIHDVIDPATYSNESREDFFIKKFDVPQDKKIVSVVARINERKNLDEFVDMAAIVHGKRKDVRFFIIGDAHFASEKRYKKKLKNKVKRLGLDKTVLFAGRQEDIPYFMRSSDIVTLPSRNEGFGRVIVEAMAVGTPVVGSSSGAIPEVMNYCEAGIVYTSGNPNEYAEAVLKILSEPEESKRLGEAGKERVKKHFTVNSQKEKMDRIYSELLF